MSNNFISILKCSNNSFVAIQRNHLQSFVSQRCIHMTQKQLLKDYYEVLGVSRNASAKVIKSAYYDKAKSYHPDSLKQSQPDAAKASKFQEISEAYEILGNEQKRRLYDVTIGKSEGLRRDVYGRVRQERGPDAPYRPVHGHREPINMNHIHNVYKALNKSESEEVPEFRPFADHFYPDSNYNRFEYSRRWDMDKRCWVYVKKATASQYEKTIVAKQKVLGRVLIGIMIGTGGAVFYHHFIQTLPQKHLSESDEKRAELEMINRRANEEMKAIRYQSKMKFDE